MLSDTVLVAGILFKTDRVKDFLSVPFATSVAVTEIVNDPVFAYPGCRCNVPEPSLLDVMLAKEGRLPEDQVNPVNPSGSVAERCISLAVPANIETLAIGSITG